MRKKVVVVGAGPVGLVMTALLTEAGIAVTLLESCADLPRDLRASTFHPPTLDMLDHFGVTKKMVDVGLICPTWQFRDRREGVVATFELERLAEETKHPYRLQCEQWRMGEMLAEQLSHQPMADIRFGYKAVRVADEGQGVIVEATDQKGETHKFEADFCVGSDGIGSIVRRTMGVEFDGQTIPEIFLTISTTHDFRRNMPDVSNIAYLSDPQEWFVLIRTASLWRALFPVDASLSDEEVTSPALAERLLQGAYAKSEPYEVHHRTAYRVHERVATNYYKNRLVIAGDAAHVNNPLGGMGLNGGIHDAFNLAKTLVEIYGGADVSLLGRYERQRRKVALDVVQQTTLRNRAILNTGDPAARKAYYDDLRATVADPDRHKTYLMRTSMISSLREVATIA